MKPGYTLIEAVAVIFLMVFTSTFILANYGGSRDRQRVVRAATDAQSVLREIQSYALSGTTFGNNQTFGYGVRVTDGFSNYTVFADKNDNSDFDAIDPDRDYVIRDSAQYQDGNFAVVPTLWCDRNGVVGGITSGDIVFSPPHPTVSLRASPDDCLAMCLIFPHPGGTRIHKVSIEFGTGRIDMKEQNTDQQTVCP